MDDFLKQVSRKIEELDKLIEEGDKNKSFLIIATEKHEIGTGRIFSLYGSTKITIDSIVEFMKTNQGNIIYQAVRQYEKTK